jgi:hypothetical protein
MSKNQRRAIHELAAENFLQIARLGGGKLVVKDDRVHRVRLAEHGEFLGLALADVGGGHGNFEFLRGFADDLRAVGLGELGQFVE